MSKPPVKEILKTASNIIKEANKTLKCVVISDT